MGLRLLRSTVWWVYVLIALVLVASFFGFTRGDIPLLAKRASSYGADFAVSFAIFASALGYGNRMLDLMQIGGSQRPRALYAMTIGLGIVALLVLTLGVLQLLFPPAIVLLLLVGVALAFASGSTRECLVDLGSRITVITHDVGHDGLAIVALTVVGSSIAYAAATNALVPPSDWDTIAYHLAIPKLYLLGHRIFYIPYIVHSNWPFNFEMLYTVTLGLGSETAPGLFNLLVFALTEMILVVEGSQLFNPRVGAIAAAFYALIPDVQRFVGTGRVDGPMSVFGFLSLLALVEGWRGQRASWFAVSGLLAGLSAGSKLTGASVGLLLGAMLVVMFATQIRPHVAPNRIAAFAAAGLLVSAPWYIKSWATTGNPFWPFLDTLFPSLNWDSYGSAIHNGWLHLPGTGTSFGSLLRLPWNLFETNSFGSPLGPLLLVFAPLSVGARKDRSLTGIMALFAVGSTLVWFYLTQQPRFLSATLIVFSLLAAVGVDLLIGVAPTFGRYVLWLAVTAWFIVQSPFVINRGAVDASVPYIRGIESRDSFLAARINAYPVFAYANANLPASAQVFLLLYENRGFYLDRPYFWANPVSQRVFRFEQIATGADLSREIQRLGFTYVLVNPQEVLPDAPYAEHFHAIVKDLVSDHLEPVFSQNGITLYRLTR